MSFVQRHPNARKESLVASGNANDRLKPVEAKPMSDIARKALRLLDEEHDYKRALDLLRPIATTGELTNAKGVCLLRLGMFDEAVRVYRALVLNPGSTWMRNDVPTVYKTNFATALLLNGQAGGCLETLLELNDEQNPAVQRLRGALKDWKKQMSLWQRMMWLFGIAPENRTVTINFEPGEREDGRATST